MRTQLGIPLFLAEKNHLLYILLKALTDNQYLTDKTIFQNIKKQNEK
jgi:hypothetical protein